MTQANPWQQLTLAANADDAENVADTLLELGAVSATLTDAHDQPLFEPDWDNLPMWDDTQVVGLFTHDADIQTVIQTLSERLNRETFHYHVTELADQEWTTAWQQYYQPMCFGKSFWVCPTGYTVADKYATTLVLDPGLAFGTGTHPTTALCLSYLSQLALMRKTIVDYGCGSGILAIAALLMGGKQAIAIDNDPQACLACKNNAMKNNITDEQLQVYLSNQTPPVKADIVIANILANTLIELSSTLLSHLKPKGLLILSGILSNQVPRIKEHFQSMTFHCYEQDGWACLVGYDGLV